jgi:AP-1 complex subunit beta-1
MNNYIETFLDESVEIQLQILTACVKLFLKKPDTTENLITNILKIATEKTTNPDIRDRGFI